MEERPATVDELLHEARLGLRRLAPLEAEAALRDGALLIDIRGDHQRDSDGLVPGAHVIARNVLEWRLDPESAYRDPACARRDRLIVLICDEGYGSSLAAATLRRLGLDATDLDGGFQAWRAAGLPVERAARA